MVGVLDDNLYLNYRCQLRNGMTAGCISFKSLASSILYHFWIAVRDERSTVCGKLGG